MKRAILLLGGLAALSGGAARREHILGTIQPASQAREPAEDSSQKFRIRIGSQAKGNEQFRAERTAEGFRQTGSGTLEALGQPKTCCGPETRRDRSRAVRYSMAGALPGIRSMRGGMSLGVIRAIRWSAVRDL